jgi:xylan 1,4-beta-xylosidase
VFRMFGQLSGQQLAVDSTAGLTADRIRSKGVRGAPDISAQASLDSHKLAVLVWYYHDDDLPGPDAAIHLVLEGLPMASGKVTVTQYRIDAAHSNSYGAWERMGSPYPLSEQQFAELERAGKLAKLGPPQNGVVKEHHLDLPITLPRQAVALLEIKLPIADGACRTHPFGQIVGMDYDGSD